MKHLVLATILTFGAGVVSAQSLDGNALWEVCSSTVRSDEAFCAGYVFGVNDGGMYTALAARIQNSEDVTELDVNKALKEVNSVLGYCTPNSVTSPQVTDIFKAYLEKNPDQRHYPAQILFTAAMKEAFPCE